MLENFKINTRELGRPIRISVYLPANYGTTNEFYQVIYLLDGQNAFIDKDSTEGRSLRIGAYLDKINETSETPFIAVGIHSSLDVVQRIDEYNPFGLNHYKCELFLNAFIKEIKPFIEKRYRALATNKTTTILGVGVSAITALYIAYSHSELFRNVGVMNLDCLDSKNKLLCFLRAKFDPNVKAFFANGDKEIINQLRMFGASNILVKENNLDLELYLEDFLEFI